MLSCFLVGARWTHKNTQIRFFIREVQEEGFILGFAPDKPVEQISLEDLREKSGMGSYLLRHLWSAQEMVTEFTPEAILSAWERLSLAGGEDDDF